MNCQKELFNLKENIHYLNCAYKAPLLKSAEEACVRALRRERNPANIGVDDYFNQTEEVRVEFAKLVNTESSSIVIIPSTSYGFSSVLNNTHAKYGGNAITIQDEFPSGYFSIKRWCKENDNDLIIVQPTTEHPTSEGWSEDIVDQINDKTSVVLISSIHWMNGIKFDLEALGRRCREVGAVFIVDGTQSVGASSIDIHKCNIDALVCATYKWLFGPYSMAIAYIGEKFWDGTPLEEAWMNRSNAKEFSSLTTYEENYRPHVARFNVGETSNFILTPMLLTSLKQINSWEPENIQQYCKRLTQPLFNYLNKFGIGVGSEGNTEEHLFALQLPSEVNIDLLKENMKTNNVHVSVRGEYIRVSVNVFNDHADIQKLIDTIDQTIDNKL